MKRAASASVLRNINRSAVLDLFRYKDSISVTEIARRLNMSVPTAKRIVEELMTRDLVRSVGITHAAHVGRPSSFYEFNGSSHAVVAVDINGSEIRGALINLAGEIQGEVMTNRIPDDRSTNLDWIDDTIAGLLSIPKSLDQEILGIGVGIPGITLPDQGLVSWAPSLAWRDLPIKSLLNEKFGLPVYIENDANLAALGELGFGAGRELKDLVCITARTGIGAGIVIDGLLYSGHNQAAGEIGYLPPGIEWLGKSYSKYGALENVASGYSIVTRAKKALKEAGIQKDEDHLVARDVFTFARNGEDWAVRIVAETVEYLALTVAIIACLLNPEIIIFSGGIFNAEDLLVGPIRERIKGVIPYLPRIEVSPLGNRGVLLGSVVLVFNQIMEYSTLRPFS